MPPTGTDREWLYKANYQDEQRPNSMVATQPGGPHNPKVEGSNPSPATNEIPGKSPPSREGSPVSSGVIPRPIPRIPSDRIRGASGISGAWWSNDHHAARARPLAQHLGVWTSHDQETMRYRMCVASGVSITRTISNSTLPANTSNNRRPPPNSTGTW